PADASWSELPGPRCSRTHGSGVRLRRRFVAAGVAQAGDLQLVVGGRETVGAADLGLQRGDAGTDELDDAAARGADEVVVLLAGMDVLEELAARAHPLLAHEAGAHQQVE